MPLLPCNHLNFMFVDITIAPQSTPHQSLRASFLRLRGYLFRERSRRGGKTAGFDGGRENSS